jgi:hypothetical protein
MLLQKFIDFLHDGSLSDYGTHASTVRPCDGCGPVIVLPAVVAIKGFVCIANSLDSIFAEMRRELSAFRRLQGRLGIGKDGRQRIAPRVVNRQAIRLVPLCGASAARSNGRADGREKNARANASRDASRRCERIIRTAAGAEALGQQRRDFVGTHGDECARGDGVATSDGTTGKDREDGQKAAIRKLAVAAVGNGVVSAKTPRGLTTIPSYQRASDSHDYTRLAMLEILSGLFAKRGYTRLSALCV